MLMARARGIVLARHPPGVPLPARVRECHRLRAWPNDGGVARAVCTPRRPWLDHGRSCAARKSAVTRRNLASCRSAKLRGGTPGRWRASMIPRARGTSAQYQYLDGHVPRVHWRPIYDRIHTRIGVQTLLASA